MIETPERRVLKVLVAMWLKDKLTDLFREVGSVAKIIGVSSKEVKLVILDVLKEDIDVAKKVIQAEK